MPYIDTYPEAEKFFSKARSVAKGRPLGSTGWRMFKANDDYTVSWYGHTVCRYRPDNTLLMTITEERVVRYSQTLTEVADRMIPVLFQRYKKGGYRLETMARWGVLIQDGGGHTRHGWPTWEARTHACTQIAKSSTRYVEGLIVDLSEQRIINPVPDEVMVVDSDLRKEWLRDLRRFRLGLKTRFKLLSEQYEQEVRTHNRYLGQPMIPYLVKCMKAEEYPEDLMLGLTSSFMSRYSRQPFTADYYIEQIDKYFSTNSLALRKEYGVITIQLEDEQK